MTAPPDGPIPYEQYRQGIMDFINDFAFSKLMGMKLLEAEPGRARMSLAWREDLCQPAGIMHGGVLAALIDTTIAQSILLTLPQATSPNSAGRIVSVDLRVKYLRPVSEGEVFCDARVVRPGRTIVHTDAVVTNSEGKQVALGDSIYMILSPDHLKKRPG